MTTNNNLDRKIPVGISSCLLGNEVRHNGGHKRDSYITGTLAEYFEFTPFCPEVGIGLGVPRPTIRLIDHGEGIRVVGVKDPELDVTVKLQAYTEEKIPDVGELFGFIFKRASPSCGMERVKVYNKKGMPENNGQGVFAMGIKQHYPELPTEEEGRLGDARLRENFIQRVLIYHYWKQQVEPVISVRRLTEFHGMLKLTLLSHNQDQSRDLGRLAAAARDENVEEIAGEYFVQAMQTLTIVATRKNHVNVLQHIQGYLKRELDADDKAELVETIAAYGAGDVPLVVPLTLLKHFFRKVPDPYIENSWYMSPYPSQLKLRNLL